jgi:uncharacterized membrane protein YtjA (UPF0391 family)
MLMASPFDRHKLKYPAMSCPPPCLSREWKQFPPWHCEDAEILSNRFGTVSAVFVGDARHPRVPEQGGIMLYYALVFLIVALVAGALGVSGVAAVATNIAYVLFVVAIVLFLVHLLSGRRTLAP